MLTTSRVVEDVIVLLNEKGVNDITIGEGIITEEVIEFESNWMTQHPQVFQNFAANILDETPLLAPGDHGIKGVSIANAVHLSSFLGKEVELPIDEDLYLAELNKKIEGEKNKC